MIRLEFYVDCSRRTISGSIICFFRLHLKFLNEGSQDLSICSKSWYSALQCFSVLFSQKQWCASGFCSNPPVRKCSVTSFLAAQECRKGTCCRLLVRHHWRCYLRKKKRLQDRAVYRLINRIGGCTLSRAPLMFLVLQDTTTTSLQW